MLNIRCLNSLEVETSRLFFYSNLMSVLKVENTPKKPLSKMAVFMLKKLNFLFKDIFFEVNKSQKTAFMISKTNKMGVEKIFMKKLKSKI